MAAASAAAEETCCGNGEPAALPGAGLARQLPMFCIIGAQKAGTTTLYDTLCRHPLVVPARRKEPHFLDWRWNPEGHAEGLLSACVHKLPPAPVPASDKPGDGRCGSEWVDWGGADLKALRRQWQHGYFDVAQLMDQPSLCSGEATPSYLLGGELIARRMRALAPDTRLIVILREPVERCFSHYRMCVDSRGSAEQLRNRGLEHVQGLNFADVVAEDLAALEAAGVSELASEPSGPTEPFEDRYTRRHGVSAPTHGAHSFVGRGLYAAQLRPWLRHFPREQLLVLFLEDMATPEGNRAVVERMFEFVGLPLDASTLEALLGASPSNVRAIQQPMDKATREQLVRFYAPHNERLQKLLGRPLPWH